MTHDLPVLVTCQRDAGNIVGVEKGYEGSGERVVKEPIRFCALKQQ